MPNYYKPQKPLSIGEDHIYPLTTIDQVILSDGQTRLSEDLLVKNNDILTLEEIQATSDLRYKLASAQAIKDLDNKILKSYSNPNLLDNPWFVNPVNQRGKNLYEATGLVEYFIDRWVRSKATSVTLNNGLLISGNRTDECFITQRFQGLNLLGKTCTFSVLTKNDILTHVTFTFETTEMSTSIDIGDHSWTLYYKSDSSNSYGYVQISDRNQGYTCELKAIKLELGSASTLANDSATNYATELLKCQRYYQKYPYIRLSAYPYSSSILQASSIINSMRTIPTFDAEHTYYRTPASGSFIEIPKANVNFSSSANNAFIINCTVNNTTSIQHQITVENLTASADL